MRTNAAFVFCCLFIALLLPDMARAQSLGTPRLEIVAQLKQRPGNIAVAPDGRMFVSMHPFDGPEYKVMEVAMDGTTKPFPNKDWAREPSGNGVGLANVIHLKVIDKTLYILDMGNVRVQPKLVAWDLAANKLARIWYIPMHVTTPQSFLQDFVITPDAKSVFIADMGQADFTAKADPALIYLNLGTGEAWRLLAGNPTVRPPLKPMMAGGKLLKFSKEGKEINLFLGLNPITLSPDGAWVYFAPMAEGMISKIRTADLMNTGLSADELATKIASVGAKPPSDGMIIDGRENIFITSVNDGSIGVLNNKGKYSTWVRDPLLMWPDGFDFGPDNGLYVTVNQLHLSPAFNKGEEQSQPPYMILRIVGGRPLDAAKK